MVYFPSATQVSIGYVFHGILAGIGKCLFGVIGINIKLFSQHMSC